MKAYSEHHSEYQATGKILSSNIIVIIGCTNMDTKPNEVIANQPCLLEDVILHEDDLTEQAKSHFGYHRCNEKMRL